MTKFSQSILIIGATGRQGGAVARQLLQQGIYQVSVLVRDRSSQPAQILSRQGATLVQGDLDNAASLQAAMKNVDGVFGLLPDGNPADEVRQGLAMTDAAKSAQIKHFIFSSAGGVDQQSGLPNFESKRTIEAHIRELGLPATVLRPVSFMDNFATYQRPRTIDDILVVRLPLHPRTRMQLICADDIAMIAADCLSNPDDTIGQTIEIAGDCLTGAGVAAVFEQVTGRPARYEEQPLEEIRSVSEDLALMYDWINQAGYEPAKLMALRQRYPQLKTLAAWLHQVNLSFTTK